MAWTHSISCFVPESDAPRIEKAERSLSPTGKAASSSAASTRRSDDQACIAWRISCCTKPDCAAAFDQRTTTH